MLNTLAGAYRVLHVVESAEGPMVRYHDRTESWFEVVTFTPPPRRDLRPLAARLQELEPTDSDGAMWCADPPEDPVPELYRGLPAAQAYALVTRELRPTALPVGAIVDAVLAHFAETEC